MSSQPLQPSSLKRSSSSNGKAPHPDTPYLPPYDEVVWSYRTAEILGGDGQPVFRQEGVQFPESWSQDAVNVVASKYFRGQLGVPEREWSLRQIIDRVVRAIVAHGVEAGYFGGSPEESVTEALAFQTNLTRLILHQKMTFNSPVWFNIGVEGRRQTPSACYPLGVEDTMDSILDWIRVEGLVFKAGSGAGVNLSKVRGSREPLSRGGRASGPVSFMRAADASAGAIKSAGLTRRAAKLVCLDVDHPDILEFIRCKAIEEEKANVLIAGGYSSSFNEQGGAYDSVQFQNANNSVRVTDEFMSCAGGTAGSQDLVARVSGEVLESLPAHYLLDEIAKAAWRCGDPGLLFVDAIDKMHTVPNFGPITCPNPCFRGDTLIHTRKGHIPIKELVGKHAEIWNGEAWQSVDNFRVTGLKKSVLRVELYDGTELFITPDHSVLLEDGSKVCAADLRLGHRLKPSKASIAHGDISVCGAYLKGFLLADGSSHEDDVHLPLYPPKYGCVERLLSSAVEVPLNPTASNAVQELSFVENGNAGRKRMRGLAPRRVDLLPWVTTYREEGLPLEVFLWAAEAKREFVAGWMDGDGTASDSRNGFFYQISSIHVQLLRDFQLLLKTIGVPSKLSKSHEGGLKDFGDGYGDYDCQPCWRLTISQRGSIELARQVRFSRLASFSYKTTINRVLNNRSTEVVCVSAGGVEDEVYCCTVEGSHSLALSCGVQIGQCGEYFSVDFSSCNLAVLNLLKYKRADGEVDVASFQEDVRTTIIAQDILVSLGEYPTPEIDRVTRSVRTLGLGYTNFGAYVMSKGWAYDSAEARNFCGAVTALMTGTAYCASAELAKKLGPFPAWKENADAMASVLHRHAEACGVEEARAAVPEAGGAYDPLWRAASSSWKRACASPAGFRNAQVTVAMPSGTTSFMVDADTTGIEPALGLVTHKKLVGGGTIKKTNGRVGESLKALGYSDLRIELILSVVEETGTVDGAVSEPKHLRVFDCALGDRSIPWRAHVDMVAAAQPFLSGGVSKSVNLPTTATLNDIRNVYLYAWEKGLKSVSIYRDGCKGSQPLSVITKELKELKMDPREEIGREVKASPRRKLPATRPSITHKFSVGGEEAYVIAGRYEDGTLGEIFLVGSKDGSTLAGFMGAFAATVSIGLQCGVPLRQLLLKYRDTKFEPSGLTENPRIPFASSMIDYLARFLAMTFLSTTEHAEFGILPPGGDAKYKVPEISPPGDLGGWSADRGVPPVSSRSGPPCSRCGSLMVRSGSCMRCLTCGETSGCG